MGLKTQYRTPKGKGHVTFNVPGVSGNYASERITIGAAGSGDYEGAIEEVTAWVEDVNLLTGASLELWLCRVADGGLAASAMTDQNYSNSGTTPITTVSMQRWLLSGVPSIQIRCKSGGVAGVVNASAAAL